MKTPNILNIDNLLKYAEENSTRIESPDGFERWVPVRPVPYYSWKMRFKAAWLVFSGRADALKWRGQ